MAHVQTEATHWLADSPFLLEFSLMLLFAVMSLHCSRLISCSSLLLLTLIMLSTESLPPHLLFASILTASINENHQSR